jgi:(S)-2-hydroxyglutarate dehydrogenase
MTSNKYDFLIIGGGIIGVNIALTLKKRHPDSSVCVVDKEAQLGLHASGRNSGVIHAGFYYSANSLKARFTRDGNRSLRRFIQEHKIPLNPCGKLVVAKDESELPILDTLLARGSSNGVELYKISEHEAREIEPRVKTHKYAIWSPTTSTSDPVAVIHAFRQEASRLGIVFHYQQAFRKREKNKVWTTTESFDCGYIVNAAGLYADQIAHAFDLGHNYSIFPFKGLYLKSNEPAGSFRTNIYPVPDLRNPFLGVHITVTVDGHHKIGPTAIPAFWREQYQGLESFRMNEFIQIAAQGSQMMLRANFDFRRLAYQELRKYKRSHLVDLSQTLATGLTQQSFQKWGRPGIRAQLLNLKDKSLEMDFVYLGDTQSFHILNSVSPGWTCAIPFSQHLVDEMQY